MQEGIPVYVDDATEENILDVCRNNMNEDKSSFTTLISKYILIQIGRRRRPIWLFVSSPLKIVEQKLYQIFHMPKFAQIMVENFKSFTYAEICPKNGRKLC